jgi:hypothetical protein
MVETRWWMYVIIGSHFVPLGGAFFASRISYCKDNIKCDSASNAPKYPLKNGVSIVQKHAAKLSSTSTIVQHYVIKFVTDLRHVGGFLRVLRFPPPINLPRYNWNIVESGVKHNVLHGLKFAQ